MPKLCQENLLEILIDAAGKTGVRLRVVRCHRFSLAVGPVRVRVKLPAAERVRPSVMIVLSHVVGCQCAAEKSVSVWTTRGKESSGMSVALNW